MSFAFAMAKTGSPASHFSRRHPPSWLPKVHAFSSGRQDEVLAFLAQRPLETVFMAGLIRDNGLVNFANRGVFYGCRDQSERLIGVALIGPKTVIEVRDDSALEAFAHVIPNNLTDHLVRGERTQMEYLLAKYAEEDREPRLVTREILMEQVTVTPGSGSEPRLRLAFREDLEAVVQINAALGREESGVDPLARDWDGMWRRAARRIDQGRVWVLTESDRMIFKADVISETPDGMYVEGVYVQPDFRRQGYALRSLTQLARNLLVRVPSISLVVNEQNQPAQALYRKVGYQPRGAYSTAYFSAT